LVSIEIKWRDFFWLWGLEMMRLGAHYYRHSVDDEIETIFVSDIDSLGIMVL